MGYELPEVSKTLQTMKSARCRTPSDLKIRGAVPYAAEYRVIALQELRTTQVWLKAYSTLALWAELASSMQLKLDFSVESFQTQSVDKAITKAKEFPEWCKKNQAGLATVKKLELMGPMITYLHPVLFVLPNLEHLDLHSTQIKLPPAIGKLTQLTFLGLSSIGLTSLPREITCLTKLTDLRLSYNKLTELPAGFENLTRLRTLTLIDNEFTKLPDLSQLWLYADSRREYQDANACDSIRYRQT